MQLPLFPLRTVLFPHGRLPLRVFEPRYVDLVRASLKNNSEFGIVWIREGREVVFDDDAMPKLAPLGTTARIVDWDALVDGTLGITVEGGEKFRLLTTTQQPDYLVIAEIEKLAPEPPLLLPERAADLQSLLQQLLRHPSVARLNVQPVGDDIGRLSNQLVQLLPIAESKKFSLLAEADPQSRLDQLLLLLDRLGE